VNQTAFVVSSSNGRDETELGYIGRQRTTSFDENDT